MKDLTGLKKNLKKDFSSLKKIKIALLGDTATQFLSQAIRGLGYDFGYDLEVFESDFNQIERQVFDSNSELYEHQPEVVIIFHSTHKLLVKYDKSGSQEQAQLCESRMELISNLHNAISSQLKSKIIYFNYPEIDDTVFGNYSNHIESSFLFQLRKLNYELMLFTSKNNGFYVCDISSVQNKIGRDVLFRPSIYVNTEMTLSVEALPHVASRVMDLINAFNGKMMYCFSNNDLFNNYDSQLCFLDKAAETSVSKGFPVYQLYMPFFVDTKIDKEFDKEFYAPKKNGVVKSLTKFSFLNNPCDWSDLTHLSASGAEKYTQELVGQKVILNSLQ